MFLRSSSRGRLAPFAPRVQLQFEAASSNEEVIAGARHTRRSENAKAFLKVIIADVRGYYAIGIMKINENTLLEGHKVVLVPYNANHVPR